MLVYYIHTGTKNLDIPPLLSLSSGEWSLLQWTQRTSRYGAWVHTPKLWDLHIKIVYTYILY